MTTNDFPQSTNFAAERASRSDRKWFDEHPSDDEFLREIIDGEFDDPDLEPPPGRRLAVHVSMMHRNATGGAVGRWRQLVVVPADLRLPKPVSLTCFIAEK